MNTTLDAKKILAPLLNGVIGGEITRMDAALALLEFNSEIIEVAQMLLDADDQITTKL